MLVKTVEKEMDRDKKIVSNSYSLLVTWLFSKVFFFILGTKLHSKEHTIYYHYTQRLMCSATSIEET